MTELIIADSWARLGWTQTLIERIQPFVAGVDAQGRRERIEYETREHGAFEHARYRLANPVRIPDEVGFTIADIAVNARSCLDMAIQAIVTAYNLDHKNPQFPIENSIAARLTDSTKRLFKVLPPEFVEVLTELQPSYSKPWGNVDIPVNKTALMIRAISNANKHRNITPAIRTLGSRGHTVVDGLDAEMLQEGDECAWPPDEATVLEVRYPRGTATDGLLEQLRPLTSMKLMVHHSGYKYDWLDLEFPVSAAEFLELAPKYVRHALTVLQQAHEQVQRPERNFLHNWDISL